MISPAPIDPPEIDDTQWRGFTGDIGWDVGSNCGQSLPRMMERFSQVHAFEPAWEALEYLYATGVDTERVTIWPVALSDRTGPVSLGVAADKIDTGQLVTADITNMEWDNTHVRLRQIPGITAADMAALAGPPDFLKIDVEGHEMAVLEGARSVLAEHHPDLLIEIHSVELGNQAVMLLSDYEYRIEEIRHPYYSEGSPFWMGHYWIRATVDREA